MFWDNIKRAQSIRITSQNKNNILIDMVVLVYLVGVVIEDDLLRFLELSCLGTIQDEPKHENAATASRRAMNNHGD